MKTDRSYRLQSIRSRSSNKSHIVQQNLNKKGQLIDKYQTQIQDLIQKMDKTPQHKANTINLKPARNRVLNSLKKPEGLVMKDVHMAKDYQGLILGLQYALQNERKKIETLENKNNSLQSEISNLRNLLVGPNQSKQYQKTLIKQTQSRIKYLEDRILQQKENYQFIIQSKNEAISNLQAQIRPLKEQNQKSNDKEQLKKKFIQIFNSNQQLRNTITKKNILIQRLKYNKAADSNSESEDDQIEQIKKVDKIYFYLQQLQISNKLILRKNIEILNLSNKMYQNQSIVNTIQQYLDRKQIKNVDLNVLQHPCVNKLRILLREKAVFQRELLNQLNQHNKKISTFQYKMQSKQISQKSKFNQVVDDNRRLASLVNNLQINIANLEKKNDQQKRQKDILKTQMQIDKKKFIEQVKILKSQLQNISSVTKNEFDKMKIQNLKLSQQNKSLLFLIGEKQKEIHNKGQSLKIFQDYKQKINNLNVGDNQKRKIQSISDQQSIGTKIMTINNFSNWLFQWNKLKNWSNKKTLLNLVQLDLYRYWINNKQEQTHQTRLITYQMQFINRFYNLKTYKFKNAGLFYCRITLIIKQQFFWQQQLKNQGLYINKITPMIVRCFRGKIQGQQQSQTHALNYAALKITNQMQKIKFKWTFEMTNQMLAVNGLKFLFYTLQKSQIDDQVQKTYNTLILIAKSNQMISFMMSFNLNQIILSKLTIQNPFIIYSLDLLKNLLQSQDYIKQQKSLLQFRKLFDLLKSDDDAELVEVTCDCILILMENSLFIKSLNKLVCLSIISQCIITQTEYNVLKKCGKIFIGLVEHLENQFITKFSRVELQKILQIARSKRFNEARFNRALRITNSISQIFTQVQVDQKILTNVITLYQNYQSIDASSRIKLNGIISNIFDRNKQLIIRFSSDQIINNLTEAYKSSTNHQQILFMIKILYFLSQQRKTTQILRSGRQSLLNKILLDSLASDYNISIGALKNLLMLCKQKYIQKFVNKIMIQKLLLKILNQRGEEQHIGLVLTCLYFLCKSQQLSILMIECGLVGRICTVILQRHQKQAVIMKCFALLQLCNTTNYKKKILNYLLTNDTSLQILKTINFILRKSKDKVNLASRAVFIYDFFNGRNAIQSMVILVQKNQWMIEDLVKLRNQFINKLDAIVYKVQLLLHQMSKISVKINKLYQKFKIQGEQSQQQN